jgi:CheY-like chemotaxis protein
VNHHPVGGGGATRETVLVADDNSVVREIVRLYLEEAGYETLEAPSVTDALAQAAEHGSVDVLITDLVMPDGDGFELATRLAQIRPSIRVLFTSGYADLRWTEAFLAKPFTAEELVDALDVLTASRESWSADTWAR